MIFDCLFLLILSFFSFFVAADTVHDEFLFGANYIKRTFCFIVEFIFIIVCLLFIKKYDLLNF